jgi:hypothetical protein
VAEAIRAAHWLSTRRSTWPVILSLHGSGERGTDGLLQTTVGLDPAPCRGAWSHDEHL